MKKNISSVFLLSFFVSLSVCPLPAQTKEQTDTNNQKEEESVKKGWTFGGVPTVAYDRDIGFLYGALVNLYNFGDGSRYPRYDHSIFLYYARTTRGATTSQITFDSDRFVPGLRTALEVGYETEQALDFYGFTDTRHDMMLDMKIMKTLQTTCQGCSSAMRGGCSRSGENSPAIWLKTG